MKYWEIIADKLSAAGWSWRYCSAVHTEWLAMDRRCAHKDDGKRYIVQSDELLSAFLELERVTRGISPPLHKWK
jgi:hypothetical protein